MIKSSPKTKTLKELSVLPLCGANIDEVKATESMNQADAVREVIIEDRLIISRNALSIGWVWLAEQRCENDPFNYSYQCITRQPLSKSPDDQLSNWTGYIWLSSSSRQKSGTRRRDVMPRLQISLPKNFDSIMPKTLWDNDFLHGNAVNEV